MHDPQIDSLCTLDIVYAPALARPIPGGGTPDLTRGAPNCLHMSGHHMVVVIIIIIIIAVIININ